MKTLYDVRELPVWCVLRHSYNETWVTAIYSLKELSKAVEIEIRQILNVLGTSSLLITKRKVLEANEVSVCLTP